MIVDRNPVIGYSRLSSFDCQVGWVEMINRRFRLGMQ